MLRLLAAFFLTYWLYGLMAATARVKNMTFVTRNTSDVERTGVRLLDPFDHSP